MPIILNQVNHSSILLIFELQDIYLDHLFETYSFVSSFSMTLCVEALCILDKNNHLALTDFCTLQGLNLISQLDWSSVFLSDLVIVGIFVLNSPHYFKDVCTQQCPKGENGSQHLDAGCMNPDPQAAGKYAVKPFQGETGRWAFWHAPIGRTQVYSQGWNRVPLHPLKKTVFFVAQSCGTSVLATLLAIKAIWFESSLR